MSIAALLELSRRERTPEQIAESQRRTEQLCREFEKEMIERYRCSECGADTLNYSHSFKCSWRGM